jgi:hypothetical protein
MSSLNRICWVFGTLALALVGCGGARAADGTKGDPNELGVDPGLEAGPQTEAGPTGVDDSGSGLDAVGVVGVGTEGGSGCGAPGYDPSGKVPSEHRAAATACLPNMPPTGAIAASCSTDADCAGDGPTLLLFCVGGRCSFDACLTDSDCSNGGVCGCSTDYYGGNAAFHPNVCVPSDCHVDSDCGPNGYCSPSRSYCGSFTGFYCHTSGDTCVDSTTDCTGCGNACVYTPTVGHFVCGSNVCNG